MLGVDSLYIDGAVIASVRHDLEHARDLAEGPGNAMARIDAGAAGSPDLVHRLGEFGHEWSYGIKKLAHFAESAADALRRLDETFRDADQSLADALTKAAHGGQQ